MAPLTKIIVAMVFSFLFENTAGENKETGDREKTKIESCDLHKGNTRRIEENFKPLYIPEEKSNLQSSEELDKKAQG